MIETAEPESNKAVVCSFLIEIGMYSNFGHVVSVALVVGVNCVLLVDEVWSISSFSVSIGWDKL